MQIILKLPKYYLPAMIPKITATINNIKNIISRPKIIFLFFISSAAFDWF